MKLTIITINFNNRDGLKKTIDSVVSQTYKDFEWIVIDGGSTDGSRELIEEYSEHFSYWCSEPDKGIYNAMNKGVAHASGEYCQFLNSGDWLVSDTVLDEVFAEKCEADIVYGDIDLYQNDVFLRRNKYPEMLTYDALYYGSIGHDASFIRRELLAETPYDENLRIVSDWKFFLLSLLQKKTFAHINKCISCFDMGGISATQPELCDKERRHTIDELAPLLLKLMVKENQRTKSHLADLTLSDFCRLCEKHPFFAKVIYLAISSMIKLD